MIPSGRILLPELILFVLSKEVVGNMLLRPPKSILSKAAVNPSYRRQNKDL